MGEYIVSARKYRPATFDDVIGQKALTTTLKNAIASGKLAHAYLFCGPRGVGKTTCARIFAKTINCLSPLPNHEACNECESCKAFNEQRSLNIHELDAASNNSVEDIRTLIEQVYIPPQIGKYKVFIIDEVHMLSTAAFNAFLKTLEEPPAHVIFILATTEKHKILPTILSRCQTYDFNRMSIQDTVEHLKHVAEQEHITYEVEALDLIAQKADGGMRDALSIFDQTASFTNGNLTYQKVIENLNVLDYDYYFRLTEYFLENKVAECMVLFNEILKKGFEGGHFISGLAAHLRDLMVSQDAITLPLLEVSDSIRKRYEEQAKKWKPTQLYRAIKLCNDCDLNYKASKNKRLLVEITLIQLAQLTTDDEIGSGRKPGKILKSIFSAFQGKAKKPVAARPQQAPAAPAAPRPAQAKSSPLPETDDSKPKIPKLKMGQLGLSIHKRPDQVAESNEMQAQYGSAQQRSVPQEDAPVTEEQLVFYWHEFANLLPREETAIAKRMKIMQPKLVDGDHFEVTVNNEQVKVFMMQMAPKIEAHMQSRLHHRNLTMSVQVAEAEAAAKVYTKGEQFQNMAKKNPNLLKLKEAFGLELA